MGMLQLRAGLPQTEGTDAPPAEPWHRLSAADTAAALRVDPLLGLSADEARRRAGVHGANLIADAARRSTLRMLAEQFTNVMILVLIGAALISGLLGEVADTVAILVIVTLNGLVGFAQEYRAQRAVAALKVLAAAKAVVRRDSAVSVLPAAVLVPGDIVLLEAGNLVPADLRLVETVQLKVDESALSGESVPVDKHAAPLAEAELALADRRNLAFKGTTVTYGRATGAVVATGAFTELGRIAALLREDEGEATPLQKRLMRFGQRLAIGAVAICVLVFAIGVLRGEPVTLMFLTAVSLAVAAIPEALPAVVTVALALGARVLADKRALVRRLPAVETLGSVTYVCSDKTGTLTENRMRVEAIQVSGARLTAPFAGLDAHAACVPLRRALALSNDACGSADGSIAGDPTERALYEAAARLGCDKAREEARAPRLGELPFDAERKRMTTLHREDCGIVAFTKGAPESVVERCVAVAADGADAAIDRVAVLAQADEMAAAGLRVLAVAYRRWPEMPVLDADIVEGELVLLALVGLLDPPRPEAAAAVALCQSAGIRVAMITGDHPATARSIAGRLGIADTADVVLTGAELQRMAPAELARVVETTRVYARVAPEQKIDIVRALQEHGHFVAMTGDGVNDAPALQRADIGIAMGLAGTDVAREAAHMVLLDDNFATIVGAVREGRRIFDNIRKFVKYSVTCNSAEVWTLFLAPFLGLPVPLLPIHILWINLVTDGLPGLALAIEPEERGIMQRPPRPPRESLFARGMWQHMLWVGLLMAGCALLVQAWALHVGSAHWQTMLFTVLAFSQLGHVLAIRSERDSLFRQGLGSNPILFVVVLGTAALQIATIYVPALNAVFETDPLSPVELGVCALLSMVVFVAVEIEKWLVRRGRLYGLPAVPAI
jgi:P-type Ca2+ transporter type 2C